MSEHTANATTASQQLEPTYANTRGRFFVWMAGLLLVINLVGFAPNFFSRGFFDTPELPLRTQIHGSIFTAWFVFFLAQTTLIARRNVSLHRRMGVAGAVLAFVMVTTGLMMIYFRALEYIPTGSDDDLLHLRGTAAIVWGNLHLLAGFSVFVTLAIYFRKQADAHKRLMLLACISMMPQSLARIARFPAIDMDEALFMTVGFLALLFSLVLHDKIVRKQLHPVSIWGPILLFGAGLFLGLFVPTTKIGQSLILLLI